MRFPLSLTVFVFLCNGLRAGAGEVPIVARGSFYAELWVVEGPGFFRDWKSGRPASVTADAPTRCPELTRGTTRGAPLIAAVTFAGPTADGYGLAHVRYHLRVLRPDGTLYAHQPDALGLRGWAGPGALFPRLGRDAVGILPERGDPPGFYLVEARVRDAVAGVDLPVLRASFLVR